MTCALVGERRAVLSCHCRDGGRNFFIRPPKYFMFLGQLRSAGWMGAGLQITALAAEGHAGLHSFHCATIDQLQLQSMQ